MKRTRRRPEDVLYNVRQFAKSRGRLPTVDEIQANNGFVTRTGAVNWMREAVNQGWLTVPTPTDGSRIRWDGYALTTGADAVAALNDLPAKNGVHKPVAVPSGYTELMMSARRVLRTMPEHAELVMAIDDLLMA